MNPQILFEELSQYYPQDYAPHHSEQEVQKKKKKTSSLPLSGEFLRKIGPDTTVLDVGCGSGQFLYRLKETTGCMVQGLDLSENAVQSARQTFNLDVFQGTIDEAPFQDNFFDVITAWSYIEHVNNPHGVIQKMFTLLKPGGYLILKTPNIASFNARFFKEKWYHLDCPRHLFLFSPETLTAMLEKTGVAIHAIDFEKNSKGLLASLQYVFYGNNYDSKTHNRVRRSKLAKAAVSPFAKLLWLIKKSDTMTVYAKKPMSK